jgi:hypothetical protein
MKTAVTVGSMWFSAEYPRSGARRAGDDEAPGTAVDGRRGPRRHMLTYSKLRMKSNGARTQEERRGPRKKPEAQVTKEVGRAVGERRLNRSQRR